MLIIFIVGLLVGLLLPALTRAKTDGIRIHCISNLKQIGLAYRMWANDHRNRFPWQVPMAEGGTLELAESPDVFQHFLACTNELSSPKVLVCSSDKKRKQVGDFTRLNNQHLSYFIGLDADMHDPRFILSGDRNITGGLLGSNGIMRVPVHAAARTRSHHQ